MGRAGEWKVFCANWRRGNASLVKGRCRACEAEGFLPVCGCDSVQGKARRNPSGPSGHLPLTREAFPKIPA